MASLSPAPLCDECGHFLPHEHDPDGGCSGCCLCDHAERPLGKLHGINMGKGVVRITTHDDCPIHGLEAQAHFDKHGRWPR